jgi:hypothetical protein
MHPTKQVQRNYFQIKTKSMLAMNFAVSSFRQLERLVSQPQRKTRLRFISQSFLFKGK